MCLLGVLSDEFNMNELWWTPSGESVMNGKQNPETKSENSIIFSGFSDEMDGDFAGGKFWTLGVGERVQLQANYGSIRYDYKCHRKYSFVVTVFFLLRGLIELFRFFSTGSR